MNTLWFGREGGGGGSCVPARKGITGWLTDRTSTGLCEWEVVGIIKRKLCSQQPSGVLNVSSILAVAAFQRF